MRELQGFRTRLTSKPSSLTCVQKSQESASSDEHLPDCACCVAQTTGCLYPFIILPWARPRSHGSRRDSGEGLTRLPKRLGPGHGG